ncbi:MAG: Fic family protein [Chloroflexi bacterium]|nr:Fic family protein [Chloroflexota bacterium]
MFARLDEKKARLDSHRPLPPAILAKLAEFFRVDWTFHSNAIEGSTITLAETRAILLDGVTIGGKSLREHLEVIVPPDVSTVPSLMYDFARWLGSDETRAMHAIEFSARAHFKFVNIHPFIDGNGRTARVLMNLILIRAGFPPAVIQVKTRAPYYVALRQADAGNPNDFIALIADAVERSLDIYLDMLPKS